MTKRKRALHNTPFQCGGEGEQKEWRKKTDVAAAKMKENGRNKGTAEQRSDRAMEQEKRGSSCRVTNKQGTEGAKEQSKERRMTFCVTKNK